MPRYAILAVAISLVAAGCTSSLAKPDPPTAAPPTNKFVYTAALSASKEVPPVTNAESGAAGTATLTLNTTRDAAGTITAATFDVTATFTGFPPGTVLTLAHIHQGVADATGGVVVSMVPSAGEVTMPNGSGSYVKSGFPVSPVDVANQIIANPGRFYFNVSTALNPGGAARGQLSLVP